METLYDVAIVGGGLVGTSLAIALAGSPLRVALIEAAAPRPSTQPSHDERNLALARATTAALDALGVWPHVAARAMPIRRLHVSRAGEFGSLRLDAAREGVVDFGAVLPARELGNGLIAALEAARGIARVAPTELLGLEPGGDAHTLRLRGEAGEDFDLRARLVVGADGTNSLVRETMGIGTERIDYGQTLVVGSIAPGRDLDGVAYERFSDQGPVALLPLRDRRAGLVLSVPAAAAAEVLALDDAAYAAYAQQRFGWRAGAFSRPGRRAGHAIRRVTAQALTAERTVLVGNAAQTIHPIGAQGFNLGLRDALTLAELLLDAAREGGDGGDRALLRSYAQRRESDRRGTLAFSDGLVRLACQPNGLLSPLRSLGLAALDALAPLRQAVARRGMGYRGTPTAYALGVRP